MKKVPEGWGEKRIYCVVAETVQAPLLRVQVSDLGETLVDTEQTRTIIQPAGRLVAQAAHVVSKTRVLMERHFMKFELTSGAARVKQHLQRLAQTVEPITTIILAARDSRELFHVQNLLELEQIPVFSFDDTNPVYGTDNEGHLLHVTTAIATQPVTKADVFGILDYLPLWSPQEGR